MLLDEFSPICKERIIQVIAKRSRVPGPGLVAEISIHVRFRIWFLVLSREQFCNFQNLIFRCLAVFEVATIQKFLHDRKFQIRSTSLE